MKNTMKKPWSLLLMLAMILSVAAPQRAFANTTYSLFLKGDIKSYQINNEAVVNLSTDDQENGKTVPVDFGKQITLVSKHDAPTLTSWKAQKEIAGL